MKEFLGYAALGVIWAALLITLGVCLSRRRKPRRSWDWPEDEYPSLGGWAKREDL
jgi:hypothetical protein